MDDLIKFAKVIGVVLAIVLVGIAIGMLGMGGKEVTIQGPPPSPSSESAPSPGPTIPVTPRTGPAPTIGNAPAQQIVPVEIPASESGTSAVPLTNTAQVNIVTNWEERLDEVLASDQTEADKARQLLAIFPRAPEAGQVELAQHLSNLVADEDYGPLGAYLTNTAYSEEVLDVLLSDLLNRPDTMKLPLLVDVARNPTNPKAVEAKDLLELYLEEDYGTNWELWRAKVQEYLKANPAE